MELTAKDLMIGEDYVSFETAKLLKAKGFDWEVHHNYHCFKQSPFFHRVAKNFNGSEYEGLSNQWYSAPTLQMAMKYLREVHHYYIQVMLDSWACGGHLGYYVVIQKTDSKFEMMLQDVREQVFYDTYEEAAYDAVKYILENLI